MKNYPNDIVIPIQNMSETFEKDIHGDFIPFNAWYGKLFKAAIYFNENEKKVKCRLWRISPVGVELAFCRRQGKGERKQGNENSHDIKSDIGEKVGLELNIAGNHLKFNGTIRQTGYMAHGYNLVGISIERIEENKGNKDKSDNNKNRCFSDEFSPKGSALCPVKNADIFFSVRQINKKGMLISTDAHNKYMIPGIILNCSVNLFIFGEVNAFFKIEKIKIEKIKLQETGNKKQENENTYSVNKEENHAKELLIYGTFTKSCKNFHSKFGEYILKYASVQASVKELNEAGFPLISLKKSIYFKFAENKEDYKKVVKLRNMAYAHKIKLPSSAPDFLEERSLIIMALYKDKLIGTLRLIFNDGTQLMENEQFVKLPDSFPPKSETLEVGRVCTHPDFRGSDLLSEMFRFTALTLLESDRKYIVTGSMKDLLPLYKKLGFKTTGVYYRYKELNNLKHEVLSLDIYEVAKAKTFNPLRWLYWNVIWEELYHHAVIEKKLMKFSKTDKLRINLIRLLKPLSFFIYSYYVKKKLLRQKQ
jgi:predicted GNAT family N-acyltransferase